MGTDQWGNGGDWNGDGGWGSDPWGGHAAEEGQGYLRSLATLDVAPPAQDSIPTEVPTPDYIARQRRKPRRTAKTLMKSAYEECACEDETCGQAELHKIKASYDTEFPKISSTTMISNMKNSEESSTDRSWDSEAEITDLGHMEGDSDWDIEDINGNWTKVTTRKWGGKGHCSQAVTLSKFQV